jgi:CheY-like chemotaxis protein
VLNLAINGRDAMPDGGALTIRLRQRDSVENEPGTGFAEVAIIDQGFGMTPDVAARALEPFFTTKGPGHGTGLGLSMAFGVARQAGGELAIDTAPGRGTTVTMALPCAEQAAHAEVGDMAADTPAVLGARTVLLVDDDNDVRAAVADTIIGAGHTCREAAAGEAALAMLADMHPDVLVIDFAMPGMNGAEVARRARLIMPDLRVVFISGYADSDALAAVTDGRTATLSKPFRTDALLAAIAGE